MKIALLDRFPTIKEYIRDTFRPYLKSMKVIIDEDREFNNNAQSVLRQDLITLDNYTKSNVSRLDKRIDDLTGLHNKLREDFTNEHIRVDGEFAKLRKDLNDDVAALNLRIDNLTANVNNQVTRLDGRIDSINGTLNWHAGRTDNPHGVYPTQIATITSAYPNNGIGGENWLWFQWF